MIRWFCLLLGIVALCSCRSFQPARVTKTEASKGGWYPYGNLKFYRQLDDPNLIAIMGETSRSSGITILEPKHYTRVEVDVVDLSNSSYSYKGMFKLEVDDKVVVPNEPDRRSSNDKSYVAPAAGKVTFSMPSAYEKIVINFDFGTYRGYRFRVNLIE